ncbi:hypothetical protein BJY04DRAFT_152937 [Aspergillus karnatakaensis]|uniref:uncharacterized protein n=1 Tax=Aspergillus karnatakaensis TaxID=1810916 RepID=UPI003CCCBEDE
MSLPMRLPYAKEHILGALRAFPEMTWGFVIYRTTYTPQSNLRFPQLINIFNSNIKTAFFEKPAFEPDNYLDHFRADNERLWARYRPVIMDDPKFNGLSLAEVRSQFESWVGPEDGDLDARPQAQKTACLVVDEEVMEVLADAKPYRTGDYPAAHESQWVKAVEAYPNGEDLEMLKVPISDLWPFWCDVSSAMDLEQVKQEDGVFLA